MVLAARGMCVLETPRLDLDLSMPMPDGTLEIGESLSLGGTTTAIFGRSGAGKTRLLRAIAGLDTHDSGKAVGTIAYRGDILLDSQSGIYQPPYQRPIGYVAQQAALFPHLSVRDNIAYAAKRALPGAPRADDLAGLLDLGALLDRRPDTLSGGERQRVALARAAARGAQLLLLDEPMAAVDRARKLEIMDAIETLQRDLGLSILLVSHALEEVMRLASNTLVLSGGRSCAYGPTLEVFDHIDQGAALGQFDVGSLFEARVIAHDPQLDLSTVDIGGMTIAMPILERLELGSRIRLRIRARDVAIALEKPRAISIRNILPATFVAADPAGQSAFLDVSLDIGGQKLIARVTRAALIDLNLNPGDPVFALIKSVSFDRRMV